MNDPTRVRVVGRLAVYAVGFREALAGLGYTPGSAAAQLQLMAHLSRWLEARGLGVDALTARRRAQFVVSRQVEGRSQFLTMAGLVRVVEHLGRIGVLPSEAEPALSPVEELLERYRHHLVGRRGLVAGTVRRHLHVAGRFLDSRAPGGAGQVSGLRPEDVHEFLRSALGENASVGWSKSVTSVLRSLLRFLHGEGLTSSRLVDAVPSGPSRRNASLPRCLDRAQVDLLLGSCDRYANTGCRDFAFLLLLARLGLRAGEVVALDLVDVDWRSSEIRVRGKDRRRDRLPLPRDVGEALADYVMHSRPKVPSGALFRRAQAPHERLGAATVSTSIVYRACDRAGIARVGAHRLRHYAASEMLAGGAGLDEIGQVLRHENPASTAIYLKIDWVSLGMLTQPWPAVAR